MSFILAFINKNVVDEKPIREFRNIRVMANAGSESAFPNISDSEFTFTEKFFDGYDWCYIWHNEDRSYYLVFFADKEYETGEPVTFNDLYIMKEESSPYEEFKNEGRYGQPKVMESVNFSTDSNSVISFSHVSSDVHDWGGTLQFVDN